MSEARLWQRLRDAVGGTGHWDRREGNPVSGVPDVSYAGLGYGEGHMELKQIDKPPARAATAVFGPGAHRKGMREEQEAWFQRRLQAGGKAVILVQISDIVFLLPGEIAKHFNSMVLLEFHKYALWEAGPKISQAEWSEMLHSLNYRTSFGNVAETELRVRRDKAAQSSRRTPAKR